MIKERWDFREAFFSDIPPSTRGPEKQSVALYSSLAVSHEALFFPNICNREQKPRPGRNVAFFRLDQRMPRNILHPRTKVVAGQGSALWPNCGPFLVLTFSAVTLAAPPYLEQLPRTETPFAFLDPLLGSALVMHSCRSLLIIAAWLRMPLSRVDRGHSNQCDKSITCFFPNMNPPASIPQYHQINQDISLVWGEIVFATPGKLLMSQHAVIDHRQNFFRKRVIISSQYFNPRPHAFSLTILQLVGNVFRICKQYSERKDGLHSYYCH